LENAGTLLDGRVRTTLPAAESDYQLFLNAGIPTMQLSWQDASERNWPDPFADEVTERQLDITGRLTTLLVMQLAR